MVDNFHFLIIHDQVTGQSHYARAVTLGKALYRYSKSYHPDRKQILTPSYNYGRMVLEK